MENENQLCSLGDKFYRITKGNVIQVEIVEVEHHTLGHYSYTDNFNYVYFNRNIKKLLFKTKEEAEKCLKIKSLIEKKKEILKEYEKKLNKELGIENNILIK